MSTERIQPNPQVSLAAFSTLGIGGVARWFLTVRTAHEAVQAFHWAKERNQNVFVLGGGSNLVIADTGFDGLVLQVGFAGVETRVVHDELHVEAGAGEQWDAVVARTVAAGFGGLECLSGIPGTVGGTPVQNVGAYGQEVAGSIAAVTAIDRGDARAVTLKASECEFGYRQSRFKGRDRDRFMITSVSFLLKRDTPTVSYADVAKHLEGARVTEPSVADVRRAVLTIRRGKGMVVDLRDTDTRSVGSFFMNPVIGEAAHAELDRQFSLKGEDTPGFRLPRGQVKIPAAWLIERAGFPKGYRKGAAGISTKHPLALINRGGATAREIINLAVEIKQRVANAFGIRLRTEPMFVGFGDDEQVAYLEHAN